MKKLIIFCALFASTDKIIIASSKPSSTQGAAEKTQESGADQELVESFIKTAKMLPPFNSKERSKEKPTIEKVYEAYKKFYETVKKTKPL